MSKKSGFFYSMLGLMFGLFTTGGKGNIPQHQPAGPIKRVIGGREITSRGHKPVYSPLNLEKKKARQKKFWMRKYNYSLQGLYLHTDNKLYWNTHALAMEHGND